MIKKNLQSLWNGNPKRNSDVKDDKDLKESQLIRMNRWKSQFSDSQK